MHYTASLIQMSRFPLANHSRALSFSTSSSSCTTVQQYGSTSPLYAASSVMPPPNRLPELLIPAPVCHLRTVLWRIRRAYSLVPIQYLAPLQALRVRQSVHEPFCAARRHHPGLQARNSKSRPIDWSAIFALSFPDARVLVVSTHWNSALSSSEPSPRRPGRLFNESSRRRPSLARATRCPVGCSPVCPEAGL